MRVGLPAIRTWIALAAIAAAAAVAAPRLWSSRFVAVRRAAWHLGRARTHSASRDLPHARQEFRAALRLQADLADARRELAELELAAGNWELAFVELQSGTEMHPLDPAAWISLARLMIDRGWLEAPENVLDRAIDADPARADARALRAGVRLRLGRYYGAQVDARAAGVPAST